LATADEVASTASNSVRERILVANMRVSIKAIDRAGLYGDAAQTYQKKGPEIISLA
jgi:hypothetical protein